MKGKLTQPQVMVAAMAGATLLIGLALGWFGLRAMEETQNQAQALADRKLKPELAAILGRAGGATAARKEGVELAKIADDLVQDEEKVVGNWREGLAKASGEGQDWSTDPSKWKDRLITANDQLRKRAGKKGDNSKVILVDDFYLGLQEFKQKSPSDGQVPVLARQLSVAEKLVEILMDAKGTAREAYPTQCILEIVEGPAVKESEAGKPEELKPKPGVAAAGMILRESYRLQFECSPEVLYAFVNRLSQDPWLFILADLRLENEQREFLKRSEVAKKFEDETNPTPKDVGSAMVGARGGANPKTQTPLLLVLAGKERLKVLLRVDFIGWKTGIPGKASAQGKSS